MKLVDKWRYPKKLAHDAQHLVKERSDGHLINGRFGTRLVSQGVINEDQLKMALVEQEKSQELLGEILVRKNILSPSQLQEQLSTFLGVAQVNLTRVKIDAGIISILSEDFAKQNCVIPIGLNNNVMQVAMADPTNHKALENIRILTGHDVEPLLAEKEHIESLIRKYLTVEKSVAELTSEQELLDSFQGQVYGKQDDRDDAPTIRLVNSLLKEAITIGASDIHWEPREDLLVVRYRVDGKLETKRSFPINLGSYLLARIKVMANLNVSERRVPQDGRASFVVNSKNIDLRISCLPTVYGEKIVVRILDPEKGERTLSGLGMSAKVEKGIRNLISGKPHGLFLTVGPTGSGKTTTIYALLRELVSEEFNIVSIEDPVEYRLPGVVSMQVNNRTGFTFANGLRSILRQDPDIIMIGEIRDEETAQIAIAAALTGHLVLTTLHTNSAAETLTRLLEMGIEPYLLAAVIKGVVSQRLIRRLCEKCKQPRQLTDLECKAMDLPEGLSQVFEAKRCPHCRETGYQGRIGLHELLLFTPAIKDLVLRYKGTEAIEEAAIAAGMVPLHVDGLMKVKEGKTSLEELWFSSKHY